MSQSADEVPKPVPKRAQPRGGSRKGRPNKIPRTLKEEVLEAYREAGGVQYLVRQATENPKAFMHLLGRLVPQEAAGALPQAITYVVQQVACEPRPISGVSNHPDPRYIALPAPRTSEIADGTEQ